MSKIDDFKIEQSVFKRIPLTQNTQNSNELYERAKLVAPGGVHSPVRSFKGLGRSPVFFKSGSGCYLNSVENTAYVDFCQSFGPLILGHLDPEIKEVVHNMVETAWTFGACEIYSLEFGEWLQKRIPWLERMRFVSSGTEAVMSVLRLARGITGKSKVLKFEGCYHGHTDSLLVQAGSGLAGSSASSSAGVTKEMASLTLVCPLDDEEKLIEIVEKHHHELAAIIIEPLPANFGLLIQRKEFLLKIQELCKKYHVLFILDEVISGFRVSLQGMAGLWNLKPDLVTYGKILGGGFPVGCYGGRADLMDHISPLGPVYQAGTLSANPMGMCAGLATLKKLERENGWDVLNARSEKFVNHLRKTIDLKSNRSSKSSESAQVISFGSLFWILEASPEGAPPIRKVEQIPARQAERFKQLFLRCLDQQIYLAPNAYEVGFISLAHTEEILLRCAETIGALTV